MYMRGREIGGGGREGERKRGNGREKEKKGGREGKEGIQRERERIIHCMESLCSPYSSIFLNTKGCVHWDCFSLSFCVCFVQWV